MKARHRVRTDKYGGYEAVSWRIWWPFWIQTGGINTHRSQERAEKYIDRYVHIMNYDYEPKELL